MRHAGGWLLLLWMLASTGLCPGRAGEPLELEIRARSEQAEFELDATSGWARDPAGLVVRYGGVELSAREIRFDRATGRVEAVGEVWLRRGSGVWTGERLVYNFRTGQIEVGKFRAGMGVLFAGGEGLHGSLTNRLQSATNAFVTTDDRAAPGQRVQARSLSIVPGEYAEVRGATFYLGSVPVLYFPRYRQRLDGQANRLQVRPGYRSRYGPYLLGSYLQPMGTNLMLTPHLDWRHKRGAGAGLDMTWGPSPWGQGAIIGYTTHDERPGLDSRGEPIDPDRHRIWFEHSAFIRTNLAVQAAVKYQSDESIVRDFFEDEYRREGQPDTFGQIHRQWSHWSLAALARPQINEFYQTVERLPELRLTGLPQKWGPLPLYYQSESSVAHLRFQYAYDTNTAFSALRSDTFHQLTLPQTLFGWLHVTPRVGGRFTHYANVRGWGARGADHQRWVFNTGAEVSTRLSRSWEEVHSRWLDLDGLRHIVEPSLNYVYVPAPSTPPVELPPFDFLAPTYRLLPVEYPQFNAIDAIDSQNVIRWGLRQRLQTHRAGSVVNVVAWSLLLDWRLDPLPGQSRLSDLYSELDWRLRSWLVINSEIRYDPEEGRLNLAGHTLTIEPNDRWGWGLGHRYVRQWPGGGGGSGYELMTSNFYFKLSENWAFRFWHYYDLDRSLLQEQYYTIYRDFRSWSGALIFRVTEDIRGERDYTLGVGVSLKAFPSRGLGSDRNVPRYLLGG